MYDNYISCNRFFCRIQECHLVHYGTKSNHTATLIKFRITAIKFKNVKKEQTITNWENIRTDLELNINFNENLQHRTKLSKGIDSTAYTYFNAQLLLGAQETATWTKSENKGWFNHSSTRLLSVISIRKQPTDIDQIT